MSSVIECRPDKIGEVGIFDLGSIGVWFPGVNNQRGFANDLGYIDETPNPAVRIHIAVIA